MSIFEQISGGLIALGIFLILLSGIIPVLNDFLIEIPETASKSVEETYKVLLSMVDYIFSPIGFLFWIGLILTLIGFYSKTKSLFVKSYGTLDLKFRSAHFNLFKSYDIYRLINKILSIITILIVVIFTANFIIAVIGLIAPENSPLLEGVKSFKLLLQILPLHILFPILLILVLTNGILANFPWIFEAILFRKRFHSYFIVLVVTIILLYVSWIFLVGIFLSLFEVNRSLENTNLYAISFESSYLDELALIADEQFLAISNVLNLTLYYLLIWIFTGISFIFVYQFRPTEFK